MGLGRVRQIRVRSMVSQNAFDEVVHLVAKGMVSNVSAVGRDRRNSGRALLALLGQQGFLRTDALAR